MSLYPYEIKTSAKLDAALRSSLMKVFPDELPEEANPLALHSILPGQHFSVQLALKLQESWPTSFRVNSQIEAESSLPFETPKLELNVREVLPVPVTLPTSNIDPTLLRDTAGLYPDVLKPLAHDTVKLAPRQWQTLWLEFSASEHIRPGRYVISLWLTAADAAIDSSGFRTENADCRLTFTLDVLNAAVKKPELKHTEWFHTDCLADYYEQEVFSEEHWETVRRFVAAATVRGINMLLTPIFTPPLDTVIGGERTTVQLIGVRRTAVDSYEFDFSKLERWIDMAAAEGMEYFEISHLFTQWGAKAAPKVMAGTEHGYKRIFGWDTPAADAPYGRFLASLLPQLKRVLDDKGLAGRAFFHISDEPGVHSLEDYQHAKSLVEPYIGDYKIMDALSNFEFYQSGAVKTPVVATDHIEPFLEAKVPGLWTYYCVSQWKEVSNRFMAMPSARTRILGWQLYTDRIDGFLQWGYNFYNTQYSLARINPFLETAAGKAFPAGDAFIVYPGENGEPWESLRMVVMGDTMEDLAALQALDSQKGEGSGDRLLAEHFGKQITMKDYPMDSDLLLNLRQALNEALVHAK